MVLVPVSFYFFFLNMWWNKGDSHWIFFILVLNYASLGFCLKSFFGLESVGSDDFIWSFFINGNSVLQKVLS